MRAVAHIIYSIDNAYSIYRKNLINSKISKKVKRGKRNTINFHLQTIKHDRNKQHTHSSDAKQIVEKVTLKHLNENLKFFSLTKTTTTMTVFSSHKTITSIHNILLEKQKQ